MTGKSDKSTMGMDIRTYVGSIDDAMPVVRVRHDSSYVTQLLAAAVGLPQMPRRRRSERREALSAYQTADAATSHRADGIRRTA